MTAMTYILITPARNEEAFLEGTILSVERQTILPEKWIIVSDGSTDRTDEIILDYASRHSWIRYLRLPEHADRQFAAKAHAFAAGLAEAGGEQHDILGNLDADLTFEQDTMAFLLDRFAEDPRLGVAGVPFVEDSSLSYDYRFTNIEHVSGACQMFRWACFEAIGGYKPIKGGGIDWLAVTTARMKGWTTRTFTEKSVRHHRKIGTGGTKGLKTFFRQGTKDFYLGNHPLWEILRTIYQMRYKPRGTGGLAILSGYLMALVKRMERPAPPDVIEFCRKEQMRRLRAILGI